MEEKKTYLSEKIKDKKDPRNHHRPHHDHDYQWQEQQKHQQKQQGVEETRGRLLWEPRETKRTILQSNA